MKTRYEMSQSAWHMHDVSLLYKVWCSLDLKVVDISWSLGDIFLSLCVSLFIKSTLWSFRVKYYIRVRLWFEGKDAIFVPLFWSIGTENNNYGKDISYKYCSISFLTVNKTIIISVEIYKDKCFSYLCH